MSYLLPHGRIADWFCWYEPPRQFYGQSDAPAVQTITDYSPRQLTALQDTVVWRGLWSADNRAMLMDVGDRYLVTNQPVMPSGEHVCVVAIIDAMSWTTNLWQLLHLIDSENSTASFAMAIVEGEPRISFVTMDALTGDTAHAVSMPIGGLHGFQYIVVRVGRTGGVPYSSIRIGGQEFEWTDYIERIMHSNVMPVWQGGVAIRMQPTTLVGSDVKTLWRLSGYYQGNTRIDGQALTDLEAYLSQVTALRAAVGPAIVNGEGDDMSGLIGMFVGPGVHVSNATSAQPVACIVPPGCRGVLVSCDAEFSWWPDTVAPLGSGTQKGSPCLGRFYPCSTVNSAARQFIVRVDSGAGTDLHIQPVK